MMGNGRRKKWLEKKVRSLQIAGIPVGFGTLRLFKMQPGTKATFSFIIMHIDA